jgi:HSP20 family protein
MADRNCGGEWNDLFRSFDEDLDVMRERMDRLMEAALQGAGADPLVYGFSMRTGEDGRPVVQELGDLSRDEIPDTSCQEPLTDIVEEGKRIKVIMELPGVDSQDIELRSEGRELNISVDTERKRICKDLELPCDVRDDSAIAEYRNGVLTVTMDKAPVARKGKRISRA